jgi:hypothetical protein
VFKTVRIALLLFILFFVAVSTWLTQARSTDWNNSLWVKLYPINADGSATADKFIASLEAEDFESIEEFIAREVTRYGRSLTRPVRIELGEPVREQPPAVGAGTGMLGVMLWSMKMRWWAARIGAGQDEIDPDVRIFVRYHSPEDHFVLENSVGLQKGMVGVVNAYAGSLQRGSNSVIIAHELLHTLGATDKYDPGSGQPVAPDGLAEPDREPLYPQRFAEIMGGRIALAHDDAVIPGGLRFARIGPLTASEIRLID